MDIELRNDRIPRNPFDRQFLDMLSALSPLVLDCRFHSAFSALRFNSMQNKCRHHTYMIHIQPSGNAHMYTLSYRSSNDEQASICIVSPGKHAVYRDRMHMNHKLSYQYTYIHVQYLACNQFPSPHTHYTYIYGQRLHRYFPTGT